MQVGWVHSLCLLTLHAHVDAEYLAFVEQLAQEPAPLRSAPQTEDAPDVQESALVRELKLRRMGRSAPQPPVRPHKPALPVHVCVAETAAWHG